MSNVKKIRVIENVGSRFDLAKFIPNLPARNEGEIEELDSLMVDLTEDFRKIEPLGVYTVSIEEGRPELISYRIYDSVQYWWLLCLYNSIVNPFSIKAKDKLSYPSLSDIEIWYFTLKGKKYGLADSLYATETLLVPLSSYIIKMFTSATYIKRNRAKTKIYFIVENSVVASLDEDGNFVIKGSKSNASFSASEVDKDTFLSYDIGSMFLYLSFLSPTEDNEYVSGVRIDKNGNLICDTGIDVIEDASMDNAVGDDYFTYPKGYFCMGLSPDSSDLFTNVLELEYSESLGDLRIAGSLTEDYAF